MSINNEPFPSSIEGSCGKMAGQGRKSGYRHRRSGTRRNLSRMGRPVWALALTAFAATIGLSSAAAASLLVVNGTFLTMKPGEAAPFVGYMLVGDDGKISAIASGAPPSGVAATSTLDAKNKIIIPGFVSAHSHAWQSVFRGLGANQYTPDWIVTVRQYAINATDDDLYWFTLHGALDHLRHGITTLFSFGYNSRFGEYNYQELQGLLDSGARFVDGFAQLRASSVEDQHQSFVRFYGLAKPHLSNPKFLRIGITGSGATLALAKLDKRLMDDFGVLNQTHYLEAPIEKEEQQKLFQNFIDAGSLGPNLFFGHFIHTTDEILKKTAAAGSGMSWQPLSNGRLASGIADIPKYLSMGVKVGMGVDGQASADVANPFENMRVGLYFLRAKYEDASIMQPIDILRLHTLGSAEVMGLADKIGSLEIGKFADFDVIAPPTPVFDVAATVVFACSSENLDAVYVGGEELVDHDRLMRPDMTKATEEVERRVERLRVLAQKK
jgi:5-methylthioadenosine/S-adenosylhomocysteine deaminase